MEQRLQLVDDGQQSQGGSAACGAVSTIRGLATRCSALWRMMGFMIAASERPARAAAVAHPARS
jgi:hypothetical protein